MLATYKRLWSLLTGRERRRVVLLLVLVLAMGFTQVAGIASVLPFMSLAANPQAIETNPYIASAYALLGFGDPRQFLPTWERECLHRREQVEAHEDEEEQRDEPQLIPPVGDRCQGCRPDAEDDEYREMYHAVGEGRSDTTHGA